MIFKGNSRDISYTGGQGEIVHLEADLRRSVAWAAARGWRWAFTLSNAGAFYFEDRCDLQQLDEIDWAAVQAQTWSSCKEGKQAEFLVEQEFPWHLIERVGVHSSGVGNQVTKIVQAVTHRPLVEVRTAWYY